MNPFTQPASHWLHRLLQAIIVALSFYAISWVCKSSFINFALQLSQYALLFFAYYVSFKWMTGGRSDEDQEIPSSAIWIIALWGVLVFIPAAIVIDLFIVDLGMFHKAGGWFPFVVIYIMGCHKIGERLMPVGTITAKSDSRLFP